MDEGEFNSGSNGNLLHVETHLRPRANSDPGFFNLPEIIVQDCSGELVSRKLSEEEDDFFNISEPIRPRSSTCPDDLFRQKPERPDTPPPVSTISTNTTRGRFSFISPSKTCVSFVHHNLSKIVEDEGSGIAGKQPANRGHRHSKGQNDIFAQRLNKDFQLKLKLKDKKPAVESLTSENGSVRRSEDKCVFKETETPAVTSR